MRVKRVFIAAMFCCYISISRLLQIRLVSEGVDVSVEFYRVFELCALYVGCWKGLATNTTVSLEEMLVITRCTVRDWRDVKHSTK